MEEALRTVKQVSELSGVTVKTLHHYHKIGLLVPRELSEAGYRLYGRAELERLQHILFYRELDFPLEMIRRLLDAEPRRLPLLEEQRELLATRRNRLEKLLRTLEETIGTERKGEVMEQAKMFEGFGSEAEWKEALKEQGEHLKKEYGYDLNAQGPIDVPELNEQAAEAARFMAGMAEALRAGSRIDSEDVRGRIAGHLDSLAKHGHPADAATFAATCRFFLGDDFHRGMLEGQQVGLAYYLAAAAEAYAIK